jgi:hypothetical protein
MKQVNVFAVLVVVQVKFFNGVVLKLKVSQRSIVVLHDRWLEQTYNHKWPPIFICILQGCVVL